MKKKLLLKDVLALLRKEAEAAGSQKELAAKLGVTAQYVSDVLNGRREPGESILKPLGLRKVINYEESEAE